MDKCKVYANNFPMKKLIFTFVVSLFCALQQSFGQYCDEPTEIGSTIDVWDWTQETFVAYVSNVSNGQTNESIINSPFYGNLVGQPNTDFLASGVDKQFLPEDGWKLVVKEFGVPNTGVRMPTFALYNRISGKLRIFMWLADKDGVDQVNLKTENFY